MLVGREPECARLDALISSIRAGASAAIVIEGEAGIGKTSLLEYAASQADGLRVLRAQGVESLQNLPFAGLSDLLRPALGYLAALPTPQGAALAGALAVGPAVPADRFATCTATLSLLAAAAADRPVLALVDDVHWLDAASAQAVEFAARRLGNEAIGLVVAIRGGDASFFDPARIDSLAVTGLGRAAARELLARTGQPMPPVVAGQLADEMGGNPLAMLEVSATLTQAQLAGLASLPDPLPVAAALRRAFTCRLDAAGAAARRILLLVAAGAAADFATLQVASGLSLDIADLTAAEEAGLVRLDAGRVEFTHPLLRSAVYYTATPAERRAAHRALADATGALRDPTRRAWHLAAAAMGPDESVAECLDSAADAARARNAYAAASRAHQRAAELTADPDRQVSRFMAAGRTAHLGGDLASAARLLSRARDLAGDPCVRADAQAMRAHATMWTAPLNAHYNELVAEAEAVQPFDKRRAATLLALAAGLCGMTGQFGLAQGTATRAADLCCRADGIPWLLSHTQLAVTTILTGNRTAGLLIVTGILAHPDIAAPDPTMHLLRILCGQALIWCEDYRSAGELLRSSVGSGRVLGRVADLPYGLAALSDLEFRIGDWDKACADAVEAVELGTDFATTNDLCYALACAARVEAAMGAAQTCRAHLDRALELAKQAGLGPTVTVYAAAALGLLELGAGNCQHAAAELARVASLTVRHGLGDPNVIQWRPDFIESLIRLGRTADANEQLAVLDTEAAATGSEWAKITAARCRGLLQDTPRRGVAQLEEAVTKAETSASAFEQARARLCLGETLRRARRRSDARPQLERAHAAFESLGARPWAERAVAELHATGLTALPRRTPVHVRLTPQELRVAMQVAEGLSNKEVATRLFLSPKTIEVHLGHIYDKLGVHSRTTLARLISSGAVHK
jgi:DNA-binding CsgD family transcriptional regulator